MNEAVDSTTEAIKALSVDLQSLGNKMGRMHMSSKVMDWAIKHKNEISAAALQELQQVLTSGMNEK